jgi:hypothetical protein
MRKMFFFVLAAAALLLMVPAQNAQAQSETPRVEFGVHYSRLSLHDFDATDHGVGTRLTMNITDGLAVDTDHNRIRARCRRSFRSISYTARRISL